MSGTLTAVPRDIEREEVQRLTREGAQLVEVLPREEYDEWHLPGALHIPLRKVDAEAPSRLDRNRAVIVYCWDDP
jgi:rhodanese-related sulfurtransferase